MSGSNVPRDYELYVVDNGFIKVSSGIQRRILEALRDGDMSPTELSFVTGRSRSTLSAHLDNMVKSGLIGYRQNEEDARSRIYFTRSDPLMKSKVPDKKALMLSSMIFQDVRQRPESASNLILRSLILTSDGVGLDMAPMMFSIGCDMAGYLLSTMEAYTVSRTLDLAKEWFDKFDLGELCVYSKDPITILFRDTVDLTQTSAEVMASFVSGFLVTLFRSNLKKVYVITDQEVFGDRNNYIRMKFEPEDSF
ncbi:MAG: winged helix-turn-helix transcriptional regulator [Thermoplasmata archaeon]|nr:winged helix-turn-helix transcriptional regulator [Thermoplasmata archaeon]